MTLKQGDRRMKVILGINKNNKTKERHGLAKINWKIAAALFCAAAVIVVLVLLYLSKKPLTTEKVAARIRPSIVGIVQYQKGSIKETGEGSGIIMSSDGYIVTNNHVIEDAYKLEVVCSNGKRYKAEAVGSDARTDLAIVKIDCKGLTAAKFGNSTKCQVGQSVVAVGNPSGLKLAGSVTQGIISAINRDIDVGNGPMNLIQTDAAINPGNSGGALVNMYGEVIAINSAKIAQDGYEGIGFSIPISSAQPVIESLIKNGYVKGRVKFGFNCRSIGSLFLKERGLPEGIYIVSVDPKSSAAANGVKADDIITAVNSVRIKSTSQLISMRDHCKPGDNVTLTIYRRKTYGTLIVDVKLMEDRGISETSNNSW